MINICVDEAYAFDFLSILEIKKNHSDQAMQSWHNCFNYLKAQLPNNLFALIINSQEYRDMVDANKKTFDAVELARNNKITSKELDKTNFVRYQMKINLQNKFFSNRITEFKK
jgi:hypothetical protein